MNLHIREKIDELESINSDVVNLLSNFGIAALFLDKTFRVRRYTPAIMQLMSLSPSDIGKPIGEILLNFTDDALLDDAQRVVADLTPLAKEVQTDQGRCHIRRITPFQTQDDRIEGVAIAFVDITELKQAEERGRESQRQMTMIVDSIADGFFTLDRQWRFTHINNAALAHFKMTSEEVIGHTLFEVFPAIHGTAFETRYRHAMDCGEPVHFEISSMVADMMMEVNAYPGREGLSILFRNVTDRYRMMQALRVAHEQVSLLARFPEENPNPVVRASADGKVLYANPASAQPSVWGSAAGDPLPEPLQPLFMEAIARRKEVQQEVHWGERVFDVSITPFPAESYANIYGRDITQRTRAESALRESEARIRLKLHSILSPEGDIGSLDLANIIDAAAIQSLMTDLYDLLRIPLAVIDLKGQVIVGVGWQQICTKFHRVHPETRRSCVESDTQLSSGVSVGKFKLYKCKNQMWDIATPIIVAGNHVGNVFCGQFFFDDERIDYDLFRSQAARFGFDEANYISALENVPRLKREVLEKAMAFFIKFADLISQMSYANINLARSVSKRDELMGSLAESNRALGIQSEQLAAANRELESFSYSVSHDLQSPLRAIDGYSRMIIRKQADRFDEETLAKFNVIRANAQLMSRLINDLLAFSRLGKAHLSIAHLNMDFMIREVWEEILATNPERSLRLTIGAIPPAEGDRGLIRQVLVNLMTNAAKFTRQQPEALIEVSGQMKDAECIYRVRDNGVGFDMQYHDKMFGVFQRLHGNDEFEGTGVGLAIVQRIVHLHGGRVWAEGKIGHGACLSFSLPYARAAG